MKSWFCGHTFFCGRHLTRVKLQRAQNACIRFVCGAAKFDHVTPLYRELRWLKLEDRRKLNIALFTLRVFKSSAPLYILKEFTSVSSVNSRSTRSNQNSLVVPHHRTAKYSHSFLVTATNIWNEYSLFDYIHLVSTSRLKSSILEKLLSKYPSENRDCSYMFTTSSETACKQLRGGKRFKNTEERL